MVITFVLVAVICIIIFFVQRQHHENAIYNKIESMGGRVVSFHRQMTSFESPFWFVGKGEIIYKIYYILDGTEQIGWVKFGLFANWKL